MSTTTNEEIPPVSPSSVKPALKKNAKTAKPKINLTWDEAMIEEHDKLRGTRMKIEEPNTPYNHSYDSGSETDGSHKDHRDQELNFDHLSNKLEGVAAVRETHPPSPGGNSSLGGDSANEKTLEDRRNEVKALEFKEHRKRHYNEMELVRKFRMEHANDDNEEDNDADDEA